MATDAAVVDSHADAHTIFNTDRKTYTPTHTSALFGPLLQRERNAGHKTHVTTNNGERWLVVDWWLVPSVLSPSAVLRGSALVAARLSSFVFYIDLLLVRTLSLRTGGNGRSRFFTLSARCAISSADGATRPRTADSVRPAAQRVPIASFARRPISAFPVRRVPHPPPNTRALASRNDLHNNVLTCAPLALTRHAEGLCGVRTHQMNEYTRARARERVFSVWPRYYYLLLRWRTDEFTHRVLFGFSYLPFFFSNFVSAVVFSPTIHTHTHSRTYLYARHVRFLSFEKGEKNDFVAFKW